MAHIKSKCVTSDQEIWYEQSINLPLECERLFCRLESSPQHSYCAVNQNEYKKFEFEMIKVSLNCYITEIL